MEDLSYYTFLAGFFAALFAGAAYVMNAAGGLTTYRQAATEAGPITVSVSGHAPKGAGAAASFGLYVAIGLLTLSMAFRAIAAERPPLGNLWEYTIALAWGILIFNAIFERAFKDRSIGAVMTPGAVILMVISLLFFSSELKPLVPALQANRILGIHVSMMVLSYSALSVSFAAAVLFLVQGTGVQKRFERLPDSETLGEIGYWSVLVGFPILTLGIALGAYWANSAWGRYWGWDPKETAALLTWLVYAGYLHARGLRGWEGNRAAWLLIIGYAAVLFTYFAVNFVFTGLHSYA